VAIAKTSVKPRDSLRLALSGHQPHVDPCLDELCGNGISTSFFTLRSAVRDSYDADNDSPIFLDRLKGIQDYMKEIQPRQSSRSRQSDRG
jgi:hypothetical protein